MRRGCSWGIFALAVVALPACRNTSTLELPSGSSALIQQGQINVSPHVTYTFEQIAVAGAAGAVLYYVYDPLAPNWSFEEKRINEDTYQISLKAKSFRVGGDGEAMQIIQRRARYLQRERGYDSYRILDYAEGIESSTPLTHRYSEGTIRLVRLGGVPR